MFYLGSLIIHQALDLQGQGAAAGVLCAACSVCLRGWGPGLDSASPELNAVPAPDTGQATSSETLALPACLSLEQSECRPEPKRSLGVDGDVKGGGGRPQGSRWRLLCAKGAAVHS